MAIKQLTGEQVEQLILADIRGRTGLDFKMIGGIDTSDPIIAARVLPVLREWIDFHGETEEYRAGLYRPFGSQGQAYLSDIIRWWTAERDSIGLSILTHMVSQLIGASEAQLVWDRIKNDSSRPIDYELLASLAPFESVKEEVVVRICDNLATNILTASELKHIGSINDRRIQQWFKSNAAILQNRNARIVAQRSLQQRQRLPKPLQYASKPPRRSGELFSTEVDVADIVVVVRKTIKDFGLIAPRSLLKKDLLIAADLDRWIVAPCVSSDGKANTLWFRLEDSDTVEFVLLDSPGQ